MQTINIPGHNFDFASYCAQRRNLVEIKLNEYLAVRQPAKLWESMRYSVLSGGKRLRALLCLAAAEAVLAESESTESDISGQSVSALAMNGNNNVLEPFLPCSCALELIHAMSLIHDDLPAMDNDDYRRGKLTNHKVYGEAMALLAGDALLMLAAEVLIKYTPAFIDRSLLLQVASRLCEATGAGGMVGGQVLDLTFTGCIDPADQLALLSQSNDQVLANKLSYQSNEQISNNKLIANNKLNINDIAVVQAQAVEAIHRGKTGALISFAVWSGAKLAGANESQLNALEQFAQRLGLAFQIADDMLDLTGDLATLGKTPGKDVAANKATWVTVFGQKKAQEKLQALEEEGLAILDDSFIKPEPVRPLKELLKFAIHREK